MRAEIARLDHITKTVFVTAPAPEGDAWYARFLESGRLAPYYCPNLAHSSRNPSFSECFGPTLALNRIPRYRAVD